MPLSRGRRAPLPAGGVLSSPASLPGCFLSLEAPAIAGLADAAAVASWDDLSLAGNQVAQGVAGQRPTFETNEIGTLPIVRFVRASTQLLSDASPNGGTGNQFTYAACLKRNSAGTTQGIITVGPNPNGRTFYFTTGNFLALDKTSSSTVGTGTTAVAGTTAYVIVALTYDGRVVRFFVNNVPAGATATAQTFTDGVITAGAYGTGNTVDADVAALFGSSVVLSARDLRRLTRYWASKYSVALG